MSPLIALDGLPASPAMARALEKIVADGIAAKARKNRINADPRIIRLRRMSGELWREVPHGLDGAEHIYRQMAEGVYARRHRVGSLIRARMAQLDDYQSVVRRELADAAAAHRQESEYRAAKLDATLEGMAAA